MRLFLGLDTHFLDLDLKKLKVNLNKGKNFEHRWVPQEFWHIPVLSFGELNPDEIQELLRKIQVLSDGFEPFDLKLSGLGAFPSPDEARVFWVGVQFTKELRKFHDVSSDALQSFIHDPQEREYRPHLPVVRLRNHRELSDLLSPYKNTDFGKIKIQKCVLLEMTSGGAFPTFRRVNDFQFREINLTE